jgi:hypothetical protein
MLLVTGAAVAVLRQHDVAATRSTSADETAATGAGLASTMTTGAAPRRSASGGDTAGPTAADGPGRCDVAARGTPWTLDIDGNGCADTVEIVENQVRVDDATFRVGEPGDDLSIGDWDCDGIPTVLLLRPASGEVFHFSWAARDQPTTGELVTVVDSATSLANVPGADGCDDASVRRASGPAVAVSIGTTTAGQTGEDQTTSTDPTLRTGTAPQPR